MHFFLKCPKIEHIHFRLFSRFKIDHVLFSRNAPLFYVRFSWNAPFFPFSESDRKNGAFQEKRTEKSGAFREKSTWSIWKREKNRKLICSILGYFRKNCICSHVKNTSFTGFLGHFMIPPVIIKKRGSIDRTWLNVWETFQNSWIPFQINLNNNFINYQKVGFSFFLIWTISENNYRKNSNNHY